MAPGPKRKGSKRNDEDKFSDRKKHPNNPVSVSNVEKAISTDESISKFENVEIVSEQNQKYIKRSIVSNRDRYNEIDAPADESHGRDFEVLLSYSGGIGSQMRLQEEKDWDDFRTDEKNIVFDFNSLGKSLKCIPLHDRLNLPIDIFEPSQIESFLNKAKRNSTTLSLHKKPVDSISNKETTPESGFGVSDNMNLCITEAIDKEYEFGELPNIKQNVISDKTENLIDSLASCLLLKGKPELQLEQMENSDVVSCSEPVKVSNPADELDFLLSLTTSAKSSDSLVQENKCGATNLSVDDWLNTILDE